jgi:hypothetical protein
MSARAQTGRNGVDEICAPAFGFADRRRDIHPQVLALHVRRDRLDHHVMMARPDWGDPGINVIGSHPENFAWVVWLLSSPPIVTRQWQQAEKRGSAPGRRAQFDPQETVTRPRSCCSMAPCEPFARGHGGALARRTPTAGIRIQGGPTSNLTSTCETEELCQIGFRWIQRARRRMPHRTALRVDSRSRAGRPPPRTLPRKRSGEQAIFRCPAAIGLARQIIRQVPCLHSPEVIVRQNQGADLPIRQRRPAQLQSEQSAVRLHRDWRSMPPGHLDWQGRPAFAMPQAHPLLLLPRGE